MPYKTVASCDRDKVLCFVLIDIDIALKASVLQILAVMQLTYCTCKGLMEQSS